MKKNLLFVFLVIPAFIVGFMALSSSQIVYEERGEKESRLLWQMFTRVDDGIILCYSGESKTTGIFVSNDGWILTAGHKVDMDFPEANPIFVKIERKKGDAIILQSTKIIPPTVGIDLLLFKVDYKPEFYFKDFKNPYIYEEGWIFGFRAAITKAPVGSGYISTNSLLPHLFILTAYAVAGNSGSPVLSRDGKVLGIIVSAITRTGDGLFIPGEFVEKYIKENLKEN